MRRMGAAGFSVYALGRSSRSAGMTTDRPVAAGLDLTVESAAEAISAAGGVGVAPSLRTATAHAPEC